ncbi:probable methyltransferase PMT2 [Tanacetum coccineum]
MSSTLPCYYHTYGTFILNIVQCLYGGAPKGPQLKDLERGADIIVASCNLGANLWERNIITMSFAPRDNHEAHVQFKRERGA